MDPVCDLDFEQIGWWLCWQLAKTIHRRRPRARAHSPLRSACRLTPLLPATAATPERTDEHTNGLNFKLFIGSVL